MTDGPTCLRIFVAEKDKDYNVTLMKTTILFLGLACAFVVGCDDKPKKGNVIGGADRGTAIFVSAKDGNADSDTVHYEMPECGLVFTDSLVSTADTAVRMATARSAYWVNVRVVDLIVTNPTSEPLSFGRDWFLLVWDGEKWSYPRLKVGGMAWEDDLFTIAKAPLRYCFRLPVGDYYLLPKGTYRLSKSFWQNGRERLLCADFEIK